MFDWLKGKKTYLVMATTFVVGGLMAAGVTVPPWLLVLLGSSGVGFLRAGVDKGEQSDKKN